MAATESGSEDSSHKHRTYKLLEDTLGEEEESVLPGAQRPHFRYPMILDIFVAMGLLIIAAGFTLGLFKMYVQEKAEQSIRQHDYKAAIALLKGAPLPSFFKVSDVNPEELLYKALYLDGLEKIDQGTDVAGGLKELGQIRPGSHFFALAQEIISEYTVPSSTVLQGGAEKVETNPAPPTRPSPLDMPEDTDSRSP